MVSAAHRTAAILSTKSRPATTANAPATPPKVPTIAFRRHSGRWQRAQDTARDSDEQRIDQCERDQSRQGLISASRNRAFIGSPKACNTPPTTIMRYRKKVNMKQMRKPLPGSTRKVLVAIIRRLGGSRSHDKLPPPGNVLSPEARRVAARQPVSVRRRKSPC